jgi:hyperpolarization activated cyclic nucleotide-gated potassium channel 1
MRGITSLKQVIEDRAQVHVNEGAVALTKLFITVIVSAHWIGCINFMICRLYDFPEVSEFATTRVP